MDVEQFVRWTLDSARSLEELYTTELIVEQAVGYLRARGQVPHISFEEMIAQKRQRALNPAHRPNFTEAGLRRAAEVFPDIRQLSWYVGYDDRQLRDLQALRFLPNLESFSLQNCEVMDVTPLTEIASLRKLHFGGVRCEDFRPLSRCTQLVELKLDFGVHWPEVAGLENLKQLSTLSLKGNLLAFRGGIVWPEVRIGTLECTPLAARSVRELPQLPACEILTLGGVERLDGIEAFPRLLNLTLNGKVRDFSPLAALENLTCFTCNAAEPLDVAPLNRLPKLYFAAFETKHDFGIDKAKPRDFSPLAEAPQLRELQVKGCPPVKTEVAGLNAGLAPWDDLFLAPTPRALPKLKVVVAPMARVNEHTRKLRDAKEKGPMDIGLRQCEAKWVARFVTRALNKALGCKDWGTVEGHPELRSVVVTVESFSVVEKLSPIMEATRAALAQVGPEYDATVWVNLKSPKRKPTKAEKQLAEQFEREQEEAEFERNQQERQDYLERLHRYELKKQEGSEIKPEEFAPPAAKPLPPAPWEREEEQDADDPFNGGLAVKKKPEPPPSLFDDDGHPLADNYRTMGHLTLSEAWFTNRDEGLVAYLIGRAPDEVIPEEETE